MGGKYSTDDWRAVRRALGAGGTVRGVAAQTGVDPSAVQRWSRMGEPPEWMWLNMEIRGVQGPARPARRPGARLTYEDRVIIWDMAGRGATHREVAGAVGCSRSTVTRELGRARGGAYDPRLAQRDAEARARRPKRRKLDASARLRAFVANHLMPRWSPEQISRRLREEFPDDGGMRVSHEAIYQALYVQGRGGLRHGLVREFFPKGTRFSEVADGEVAHVQWLLNNRPRKVLGWRFPAEVIQEVLSEGATIA